MTSTVHEIAPIIRERHHRHKGGEGRVKCEHPLKTPQKCHGSSLICAIFTGAEALRTRVICLRTPLFLHHFTPQHGYLHRLFIRVASLPFNKEAHRACSIEPLQQRAIRWGE